MSSSTTSTRRVASRVSCLVERAGRAGDLDARLGGEERGGPLAHDRVVVDDRDADRRRRRRPTRHRARHSSCDVRAAARPAPDVEDRADPLRPLLHVQQPEVAVALGARRRRRARSPRPASSMDSEAPPSVER